MNLTSNLLPSYVHWAAHLVYLALLFLALYSAPWQRLRDRDVLNVFLGSCVLLLLIWSLKAGVRPGLNFHLLGGALFTLMYGWQVALIGLSLVLFGATLNGAVDWPSFSINMLLMAVLPVFITHWVYRMALRYLPHHFFVYVMVNGFFCAGLTMAVTVVSASMLLVALGPYSLERVLHDYLPFTPFMVFGEGFMTGMLATGMALMKPHWLTTFDDRRYIAGK